MSRSPRNEIIHPTLAKNFKNSYWPPSSKLGYFLGNLQLCDATRIRNSLHLDELKIQIWTLQAQSWGSGKMLFESEVRFLKMGGFLNFDSWRFDPLLIFFAICWNFKGYKCPKLSIWILDIEFAVTNPTISSCLSSIARSFSGAFIPKEQSHFHKNSYDKPVNTTQPTKWPTNSHVYHLVRLIFRCIKRCWIWCVFLFYLFKKHKKLPDLNQHAPWLQ